MNIGLPKNIVKYTNTTNVRQSSRSGFEAVLLIIVAALVFWFLIQPKRAELTTNKASLEQLNRQSEQLEVDRKQLEELVMQLNTRKDDLSKLDEALPLDARITKVHILLEDLATRSGVVLASLGVVSAPDQVVAGDVGVLESPFKSPRQVQKIEANMSMTGTFDQFIAFIKSLERSARIVDISSIDMNATSDTTLDFSVSLTTYYFYE